MKRIAQIEKGFMKDKLPAFGPGDTVKVHVKIKEGDKERIQVFQGTVISRRGSGINETFTVRKISAGIGVERIFPLHSPNVSKIQRTRQGKVRRAKLYYLRGLTGKSARIEEKIDEKTLADAKAEKEARKAKAKAKKTKKEDKAKKDKKDKKTTEKKAVAEKPKVEEKVEAKVEEKAEVKTEAVAEKPVEEKAEAKVEEKTEAKAEEKAEAKVEEKTEAKVEEKTEAKDEKKSEE